MLANRSSPPYIGGAVCSFPPASPSGNGRSPLSYPQFEQTKAGEGGGEEDSYKKPYGSTATDSAQLCIS